MTAFKFYLRINQINIKTKSPWRSTEYIRNKIDSKIPIIALTADVTTVDVEKCKAYGMNDYISKPIDEKLLFNKIVSLVK